MFSHVLLLDCFEHIVALERMYVVKQRVSPPSSLSPVRVVQQGKKLSESSYLTLHIFCTEIRSFHSFLLSLAISV